MRPWEEALFIKSNNNYKFFVQLHDYLFACSNEVNALGAESLGPISTTAGVPVQCRHLSLHKMGFVLCLIFDFCNRVGKDF